MNHALLRSLLQEVAEAIKKDTENASFTKRGIDPLFFAGPECRNMIVGQAPGLVPEKRKEVGTLHAEFGRGIEWGGVRKY